MNIGMFHGHDREAAVLKMARLAGCDCDPDIEVQPRTDDLGWAHVAHDDWCRLIATLERRN